MKKIIKKILPSFLLRQLKKQIEINSARRLISFDKKRFLKSSFSDVEKVKSYQQLEARLTKEYHSLEKGLSYTNIRLGFGQAPLKNVIDLMHEYRAKNYLLDNHVYTTALSNLKKYIEIHEENNHDVSAVKEEFSKLVEGTVFSNTGGILKTNYKEIERAIKGDFKTFSKSRHSVRDYSDSPVDIQLIEEALQLAVKTPSACNRQPWKVRVVEKANLKKLIQKNQNGNRGFGDSIDKYLIITVDSQYYSKERERNQANIDGGMYAMNLLYSLHYQGLATVPLSASLTLKQETNLRNIFNIGESENFIMFIGVGNYTERDFKVPKSSRKDFKFDVF